jgi:hypothetical protein
MEDHKAAKRKLKKVSGEDSSDDDKTNSNIGGLKRVEADIEKKIKGIKTDGRLQEAFFDKVAAIKKK